MKNFKINDAKFDIITSIDEIWHIRQVKFVELVHNVFENTDNVVSSDFTTEMIKHVNDRDWHNISVVIENFKKAVSNETNMSSIEYAFSLITLVEGEKQSEVSKEYHSEKMKNLIEKGITTGVITGEVLGFITRHPFEFRTLGEAVRRLSSLLYQNNELEDSIE